MAALWNCGKEKEKRLAVLGIVSATIIVILSESSGPLMTYVAALLTVLGWRLRKNVRSLWYLMLAELVVSAIVMKAPIWFLFSRVSDVIGEPGIIDQY